MDTKLFRRTLGQLAGGVTVITVKAGEALHGMTASAVCSVSLNPPLVLCCVDHKTKLHALFDAGAATGFAMNILARDQEAWSNHFASIRRLPEDPLAAPGLRFGPSGSPLLPGCLAWIDCRLHSRLAAGDHTIYVGEVLDLNVENENAEPLVYLRSQYGTVR